MVEKFPDLFIGIDVQIKRGCPYYIVDSQLAYVDSGWLMGDDPDEICDQLTALRHRLTARPGMDIAVGIDAPRRGLTAPRAFFWRDGTWHQRTQGEKGFGRHCEVVIKALGLGNPQWTRHEDQSPPWMVLGYRLFQTLSDLYHLYEVFPSVSFRLLNNVHDAQMRLSFANFTYGPKDMLDACVSAYTVHAFVHGQGCEVGGGDGLGTIILPGRLPDVPDQSVLHWPEKSS